MRPLGYEPWWVWGGSLDVHPSTPAGKSIEYLARNLFRGVRLMIKFTEWDDHPDRVADVVERYERAREYELQVMLCIDWHNIATRRGEYHLRRIFPRQPVRRAVRDILRVFRPDVLQVCNEPYHIKRPQPRLSALDYRCYVDRFVEGAHLADWAGLLVANWTNPEKHRLKDGWEFHVQWPHCAEGRHSAVLHDHHTGGDLLRHLRATHPNGGIGNKWPWFEDEHSSVGRRHHIDTIEGADMLHAGVDFFRSADIPMAWLQMGGHQFGFGGGEWGMHTNLINHEGRYSEGAKRMMRLHDVEVPPDPEPVKTGIQKLRKSIRLSQRADRETYIDLPEARRSQWLLKRAIRLAEEAQEQ